MRLIRLLKKDLAQEIATWVNKGLISEEQGRSICHTYGMDYDSPQSFNIGYHLLVFFGYLFIGVSLIILIGANWESIPRGLRMGGLILLTVATHFLALRAYFSNNLPRAIGLFLLGNLFYGASIILIAQIYHLGEHMPDGVYWWALGSLPFGVLLCSAWLTLFSSLLALLWFWLDYTMGFFPVSYPIFLLGAIYVLFRGKTNTWLFLITVIGCVLWIEALLSLVWNPTAYWLDLAAEHLPVTVALFIFIYALSQWMYAYNSSKAKDYGALLALWSLRFGLLAMFILTFNEPWREMIRHDWEHKLSMWFFVSILVSASLWLAYKNNFLKILVPIAVFCVLSITAAVNLDNTLYATYLQVVYNIAVVVVGISLIISGIHSGISHYFFLGVMTILLIAFMRYIDLIGDYIGGALLFMVLAGVLLGAARYWKATQRKITAASTL